MEGWESIVNGRKIRFTYKRIGLDKAEMTAQAEGDDFIQQLKKSGIKSSLTHQDVEDMFPQSRFHAVSK